MADERKVYEAIFEMAGKVDKSLISAARDTKALLKSLDMASMSTDKSAQHAYSDLRRMTSEIRAAEGTSKRYASVSRSSASSVSQAWREASHKMHAALLPVHNLMGGIMRFSGIGALIGMAGGAYGGFEAVKSMVDQAGQKQLDITSLKTLLKGQEAADQMYDWIFKYTAKSQFRMDDVIGVARQGIARGMTQEQVKQIVPQFGDIASGLGIKQMGDLSLGFMEAFSGGNANLRELNMMTIHGVPMLKDLSKNMGVTEEALKKLITKRKVTFDMLQKAMKSETGPGGIFFGATAAGATTYLGRLSTLKDYVQAFQRTLGTPIMVGLTNEIGKLVDGNVFGKMYDWANKMAAPAIAGIFSTMDEAMTNLSDTGEIHRAWADIKDIFGQVRDEGLRMLGIKPGSAINAAGMIEGAFKKVREVLDWIDGHMAGLINAAKAYVAVWMAFKVGGIAANMLQLVGSLLLIKNALAGMGAVEGAQGAIGFALFGAGGSPALLLAIAAVGAAIVGIGLWKSVQPDKELNADALAARNSARATQGLPAQSAADAMNDPAMKAHWDRYDKFQKDNPTAQWFTEPAQSAAKGLGDIFNNIRSHLPSDDAWNALKTGTVDSAAGLSKIVSSSSGAAASLDTLSAKINAFQIPWQATVATPQHQGNRPHALGGLFTHRHNAVIAESGPEMVIPLTNRVRASRMLGMSGGHTVHFSPTFNVSGPDPDLVCRRIKLDIEDSLSGMIDRINDQRSFESFA